MDDLQARFAEFHFLRPAWLALLPVAAMLWWWARRKLAAPKLAVGLIAPHLREALTVSASTTRQVLPVDIAVAALALLAVAAAGPVWERAPNPLLVDEAPMIVLLEVTETMTFADVAPSRVERAKLKVLDLLGQRAGARTGLAAYAGTAHQVVPPSEDPQVVKPFLEAVTPEVMPVPGEDVPAAVALARRMLATGRGRGVIVLMTDGVPASQLEAVEAALAEDGAPAAFVLPVAGPTESTLGPGAGVRDGARLHAAGFEVVAMTPDDSDVRRIVARASSLTRAEASSDDPTAWIDRGHWVIWIAAGLLLVWFRPGMTMPWLALVLSVGTIGLMPTDARADGWVDLLATPDQQGRWAYEQRRFEDAGAAFADPMWRGIALYRAGKYLEASESFARVLTPEGAFNRGNALVKGREYAQAVEAYERLLEAQPEHAAAQHNLAVARAIIRYLDRARSEGGTGGELEPDAYKFDNQSDLGETVVITGAEKLRVESAEQWMRTVDTDTRDFLKTRFSLEAAKASAR